MRHQLLSLLLAVLTAISMCPAAFAAETPAAALSDHPYTRIVDLSALAPNESVQWTVMDEDGRRAVVGVTVVTAEHAARSTDSKEVRVWYSGYGSAVEFYMTVSNNKVTDVYGESISLTGVSYQDVSLTHTSTYGKLSFSTSSLGGLIKGNCWLKGTVTGTNNEVEVTWKM